MNLRQTAEIATLVATSASHIVECPDPVPTESLHGYWKQARTRMKCWFAGLQTVGCHRNSDGAAPASLQQQRLASLCRDILAAEMLIRVWSTVLVAADCRRAEHRTRAAVDTVFRGQLEARREVLRVLAAEGALPASEQAALDRFRRRIERWTDALLGPLVTAYGVADFVFDESRARDFAENALQQTLQQMSDAYRPLLMAGIATAFPRQSDADRERAMLNLAIVRAILAAFPKSALASDGRLRSAACAHLERSSTHPESPPRADSPDSADPARPADGLNFVALRRRERPTDQD